MPRGLSLTRFGHAYRVRTALANCYLEAQDVTQVRDGLLVVHGYPFEDAANAKIVAHLVGLLRRMV